MPPTIKPTIMRARTTHLRHGLRFVLSNDTSMLGGVLPSRRFLFREPRQCLSSNQEHQQDRNGNPSKQQYECVQRPRLETCVQPQSQLQRCKYDEKGNASYLTNHHDQEITEHPPA